MTPDTKLLLDEMDKLFAKQNARWDRLFATHEGTLPVQISTELPAPAPAPTVSPPTTPSAATTISKLFDKVDARWAKEDAVKEAARGVPIPSQSAAVEIDVVADNWGDLFDGDHASDE
ncbi:unnamed protein product [Urochloa humidicola]